MSLDFNNCIFHYTKLNILLEYIFREERLKFSTIEDSHDLYEANYNDFVPDDKYKDALNKLIESNIIDKLSERDIYAYPAFFVDLISSFKKNYKMLSFSISKNGNVGCLKNRMWSQYGDSNKGVCLVFNKNKIINLLENDMQGESRKFHNLNGIKIPNYLYGDINYDPLPESQSAVNLIKYIPNNSLQEFVKDWLFVKPRDYIDENEYRVFSTRDYLNLEFTNPTHPLEAIILGNKFNYVHYDIIYGFADVLNIKIGKIKTVNGHLSIDWNIKLSDSILSGFKSDLQGS